jgi:glycosyltransferase involved in cell wall biosynthesis
VSLQANSMRIVHFIDRLDPSDGGPPAAVARLAAAQARAGHSVQICANEPRDDRLRFEEAYAAIDGFSAVIQRFFPHRTLCERVLALDARRTLPGMLADADIAHVHGVWRPLLLQAARASSGQRLAYCVTPHGMLSSWGMAQKSVKKRLALALAWRSVLARAAFLHYVSDGELAASAPLGLDTQSLVLPNGIDVAELDRAASAVHADRAAPLPERFILFVGRLHYSKGLDLLCDAFAAVAARLPEVSLVVVGPDFGYGEEFARRTRARSLAGRVHVLGPVYGAAKLALMRGALCLCLPSRQEGFSVTILESLACGRPAVISEACNFAEVEAAGAGFVTGLSSAQIADRLVRLCGDEQLRSRQGRAARELVQQRYGWDMLAARLVERYAVAANAGRVDA